MFGVQKISDFPIFGKLLFRWAVLAMLASSASIGQAALPPWPDSNFTYIADSQTLVEVLKRFGKTFGLETRLTEGVINSSAVVNGRITTNNPGEFLNQLGSAYGLSWFVQNGILYISRSSERTTKSLSPPGISAAGLKKALSDLGVLDPKFGWGEVPERGIVLISGPEAYVNLVIKTVQELPVLLPDLEIQIFRLRYAPVNDRIIFYRDRQISTPGVASILRGLVSGDARFGTNVALSEMAAPLRNSMSPLPALDADAKQNNQPAAGNDMVTVMQGASGAGRGVIQADPRLNAIVIRDKPENMRIYKQLIPLLDVPSQLVEIEAMILDVNSTQIAELGIDWNARVGRVSGNIGNAGAPVSNPSALISIGNANAATIISDAGNFLLSRINALERRGQAKVISRPSILTVDNQGALIDLAETFYIQSVGERVANVTPVSVGVTLKVTPHIIEENGNRSVQLLVDIEDGSRVDQLVNGFPAIRRSNIGTQAVVNEHDSLLIGGFNSESTIRTKDAVPVLGNMPVFGALFNSTKSTVERKQRLFLITPRIVSPTPTSQPLVNRSEPSAPDSTAALELKPARAPAGRTEAERPLNAESLRPIAEAPLDGPLKIRMDMQIKQAPTLQIEKSKN